MTNFILVYNLKTHRVFLTHDEIESLSRFSGLTKEEVDALKDAMRLPPGFWFEEELVQE